MAVVVHLDIPAHRPGGDPGAPDDEYALFGRPGRGLDGGRVHVPVAVAGNHDAFGAAGHGTLYLVRRHVGAGVHDIHPGQGRHAFHGKFALVGVLSERPPEIGGLPIVDGPDQSIDGRDKGFHRRRIGFREGMGPVDTVVHHHQDPSPARLGVGGNGNRVVKVQRAIRADGCGRPHGPGHDHGFFAFHGQVEKMRRLFHGIRAVGDDNAIRGTAGEEFVDPAGQLNHDREGHVLGTDVGDLLPVHIGQRVDSRHRVDHGVDAHLPGGISGLCPGFGGAGNGTAGGQDDDFRHFFLLVQVLIFYCFHGKTPR